MQLEAMFHSGNPSFKTDERYDDFIARIPYFNKQLENIKVTRQLLWSEYIDVYFGETGPLISEQTGPFVKK